MRQSLRLLGLSGFLWLAFLAASARPALAICYICFDIDPCTGEEIYGNSACCSRGHGPVCHSTFDPNGCLVSVTTACS
jgi:hypothetical protein